jgi:hypothetical protein
MIAFRFGIRDLLWAMTVVALVVVWWVERERCRSAIADAEKERLSAELQLKASEIYAATLERIFIEQHPERVGSDINFEVAE